MTSPHSALPPTDEHNLTAAPPNNVALSYLAGADAGSHPDADADADAAADVDAGTGSGYATPFSAFAASATLATPSDSRPPTSHGEDAVSDDDDTGGGISLADLTAPPPAPSALLATTLGAAGLHMQAAMAHFQSFAHDSIPPPTSDMTSFHVANVHLPPPPPPPPYLGHLSSSEPALEPLPAWPDAYLSIKDKSQFVPITSFFHYLTPEKSTVPGLDLVQVPNVITREHLQGDKYDYQGIDWSVRNTTRGSVRTKRRECEEERLSPGQRVTRTVGSVSAVMSVGMLTRVSSHILDYATQTASSPSGGTPLLTVPTSPISSFEMCWQLHQEMTSSMPQVKKFSAQTARVRPPKQSLI